VINVWSPFSSKKDEKQKANTAVPRNETSSSTAKLNDAVLMRNKGITYSEEENYKEAMKWYKKAAELNDSEAMRLIGCLYQGGNGVEIDYGVAYSWYKKAAALDNSDAMINAGLIHEWGDDNGPDYEGAMSWYLSSAANDNPRGMYFMGYLYEREGKKGEGDYKEAMSWYKMASERGNTESMLRMGYIYHYGVNGEIERDHEKSEYWYRKAAELGNEMAIKIVKNENWDIVLSMFGM
jgi:TPR repeat protein